MFVEKSEMESKTARELGIYLSLLHSANVKLSTMVSYWLLDNKKEEIPNIREILEKASKKRLQILEDLSSAIFSRRGLYLNLVFELKKIEDFIEASLSRLEIIKTINIKLPSLVKDMIYEMTDHILAESRFLVEATGLLNSMEIDQIPKYYKKISDIEKNIDIIRRAILAALLRYNKINYKVWYLLLDLLNHLEDIADYIENAANFLYLISIG